MLLASFQICILGFVLKQTLSSPLRMLAHSSPPLAKNSKATIQCRSGYFKVKWVTLLGEKGSFLWKTLHSLPRHISKKTHFVRKFKLWKQVKVRHLFNTIFNWQQRSHELLYILVKSISAVVAVCLLELWFERHWRFYLCQNFGNIGEI